MKILHSADLHLDSPFAGLEPEQAAKLRRQQRKLPEKLAALCKAEKCDLVLLAGDLFDGAWTKESLDDLRFALKDMAVPVFISPGNHDFCGTDSPYLTEKWPENVYIFTRSVLESVTLPELDCKIYGAGYRSMDCDPLLEGFHAEGDQRFHIGLLHGDAMRTGSTYCPITADQVRNSGLDYLALGHIHKTGSFRSGRTLCAWPGCPMGRGFDEPDVRGVMIVTLDTHAEAAFIELDLPRFYDLSCSPSELSNLLPPVGNDHFYRITLTGEAEAPDLKALYGEFARFPNLELRDRTVPPLDLWGCVGEDSLEGVFFRQLKDALDAAEEDEKETVTLAARIARQILDGQEVVLP